MDTRIIDSIVTVLAVPPRCVNVHIYLVELFSYMKSFPIYYTAKKSCVSSFVSCFRLSARVIPPFVSHLTVEKNDHSGFHRESHVWKSNRFDTRRAPSGFLMPLE